LKPRLPFSIRLSSIIFAASFLLLFLLEGPPKNKLFPNSSLSYFIPPDLLINDSWYEIDFAGEFIGYCHYLVKRSTAKNNKDGYILENKISLKIPMLGKIESFDLDTKIVLKKDYSLINAKINFQSNKYFLRGNIDKENSKIFRLNIETPTQKTTHYIDASSKFISTSFMPFISNYLPLNKKTKLSLFDPLTNREITIYLENKGYKNIHINGKEKKAVEISLNIENIEGKIYTDTKGHLLQQEILGLKFIKKEPQELFKKTFPKTQKDLINNFTIVVRNIPYKERIKTLTLKINGLDIDKLPQKPNQHIDKYRHTVTISKIVPKNILTIPIEKDNLSDYLKEDAFIKFNHNEVEETAKKIVGDETDPLKIISLLLNWINTNIKKTPTVSIPNSLDTLKMRQGDCGELSALFVGFLRSLGIPSYVNIGLVYLNSRFFYHAWVSAFVGEWIDIDPALNQPIADATHLTLREGLKGQFEILEFIGKIKIKILNCSYEEND